MAESSPLVNGIKAIGDTMVLPGSSLLIDGDVKSGVIHAVGGVLGRAVLGPVGWLLVGANAFSNSVSGKHLHQHFIGKKEAEAEAKE